MEVLPLDVADVRVIDEPGYASTYRRVGRYDERRLQIELITGLGHELIDLVRHPLVLKLIRALRIPARVAGFGLLQDFLEEGLQAFQAMRDGSRFVDTIQRRETRYMERLIDGEETPYSR